MNNINLSPVNEAYVGKLNSSKKETTEKDSIINEKNNADEKIKLALTCLAALGVVITAGVAMYRHRNPSGLANVADDATQVVQDFTQKSVSVADDATRVVSEPINKPIEESITTLEDIIFKKGHAKLKNGKEYTGIIEHVLPDGDKVSLEYANGVLKKSTRSGKKAFEKTYEKLTDGSGKITILQNGEKKEVLLRDIRQQVYESKKAYCDLVLNNQQMSIEEVQKKVNSIKYKNKEQKEYIEEIISDKKLYQLHLKKQADLDNIREQISNLKKKADKTSEEEIELGRLGIEEIKADIEVRKTSKYCVESDIKESELELSVREAELENLKKYFSLGEFNTSLGDNLRKPDRYDGITYDKMNDLNRPFYKVGTDDYNFYLQNRNLTVDSDVDLFIGFDKRPYDIPERFAIMADNTLKSRGNAYITDNIPEIFADVNQSEVMDTLSKFARADKEHIAYRLNIGGKEIIAKNIGGGEVGVVYKLTDQNGHSAALKIYSQTRGSSLNINSGMSEIATSRQLTRDGVVDVPRFYMANGALTKQVDGVVYQDVPWMLSEYIEDDKIPTAGKKLSEWLKEHFMYNGDAMKNGRTQGGYILDLGGMVSKNYGKMRDDFGISGFNNGSLSGLGDLLEIAIKQGKGVEDILKIFK